MINLEVLKLVKMPDVVLWSDNPLSIYAKVEKTIIDGAIYYDYEMDEEVQKANATEKARIIEQLILEKNGGAKTQNQLTLKNLHYTIVIL